jgi:hypothetical protein
VVQPVVGLCSVDIWSEHTQAPTNDAFGSERTADVDAHEPETPA